MNDHHLMLRKRPIHVTTDCVWTTQFCYWRCVWNLFAVECMKMNKKKNNPERFTAPAVCASLQLHNVDARRTCTSKIYKTQI